MHIEHISFVMICNKKFPLGEISAVNHHEISAITLKPVVHGGTFFISLSKLREAKMGCLVLLCKQTVHIKDCTEHGDLTQTREHSTSGGRRNLIITYGHSD